MNINYRHNKFSFSWEQHLSRVPINTESNIQVNFKTKPDPLRPVIHTTHPF